ncbi:glycosyl transferase family 2 [Desulfovibrio sp. X2]|uniref:glycosyltransferase family 2 protein n=1 Tax=Desulfovibrio sp. X2 TaxID=941449 RepID=UPI000358D7FC|nr:glycosyltransferase family 2 protein [Desulfovibrio sp. X2]EPR43937.1 glycosyl transferase family 2 [Desulfovibrio sp. X2]
MTDSAPELELTILMPCLNEAETLGACVGKAMAFLGQSGISGEVLVADNGSSDGSQEIAQGLGARVVHARLKGYGAALQKGVREARGRFVIMGDADDSYDFSDLGAFVEALRGGAQIVMGNRFKGGIAPGAMPFLHRYLGNPVLSFIGRLFFKTTCGDFHCGLRGFDRDAVRALDLHTPGMEYASEMVVRASLEGLRIAEVPTKLSPDGRSRPPHLRTWRDGWRHLCFLLIHAPRWLFVYPGMALLALGFLATAALAGGPVHMGAVTFSNKTFLLGCLCLLVGLQSLTFGLLVRRYATRSGLLPRSRSHAALLEGITLERMALAALGLFVLGAGCGIWSFVAWGRVGFGDLGDPVVERTMIAAVTFMAGAVQTFLSAFVGAVMEVGEDTRRRQSRAGGE